MVHDDYRLIVMRQHAAYTWGKMSFISTVLINLLIAPARLADDQWG